MTSVSQKNSFWLFGKAYDRVGDGDKFSYENFRLRRSRFHVTSHLRIEAEVLFL